MHDHPFRTALSVRGHELDGHGVVSTASWLHYFEHARAELHATAHGAVLSRTRLLARAQRLSVRRSVGFGTRIGLEVWVSRIGRTSFEVAHRAVAADGAELAVDALTFVSVDSDGRPITVDAGVRELLYGEALSFEEDGSAVLDAGPSAAPPENALRRAYPVLPSDENHGGHLSHAHIAEHFDDHRRLWARARPDEIGCSPSRHLRSIALSYEGEAHFGHIVELATWAVPCLEGEAFAGQLAREGVVIARARMRA